jgi:peptidoglycan/LPS O-acetylase OafA/YrhL
MRHWWRSGRRPDEPWSRLTEAVGLAGFVVLVYAVIVLGGGVLIGRTGSPSLPLSVLATAVVALTFERVRRWVQTGGSDVPPT